ncbi:MAG: transposase, partial [bacterium]|nr:transposase [bacterium]
MRRRKPEVIELDAAELATIVERTKCALDAKDYEKLKATVETCLWIMVELEKKNATLARLRKDLSINTKKTEKTSTVLKESQGNDEEERGEKPEKKKRKPKGHGRNGADAYEGAEKIKVPHASLKSGDYCPECKKGKLSVLRVPLKLVRVKGQAPLQATVYELERLRCNLCGEVFRAEAPAGIGKEKYDPTAASMIGLLKYGSGLPFNRLQRLGRNLKIPLPASTQWGIVKDVSQKLAAAFEELIRQAAQGHIFYNDDTSMKILTLLKENQRIEEANSKERTGIFTSAIVSICDGHKIAVFFTGRQHAGENLRDVLQRRASELEAPIHMCDGLSRNEPKDFETIVAYLMPRGPPRFAHVADTSLYGCVYVLESLRKVFRNDAIT